MFHYLDTHVSCEVSLLSRLCSCTFHYQEPRLLSSTMGRPPNPYQRRPARQPRQSKRPNSFDPTPASQKSLSSYALKEKIRDLTRLLEHSTTMPADVRIEKERALAGYRADFEKSKAAVGPKKRNDIVSRYHMVRFFGMSSAQNLQCLD